MAPRIMAATLLLFLTACSTTHEVRLDTGQGEPIVHIPRSSDAAPIEIKEEEFVHAMARQARAIRYSANPEQDARKLFQLAERSGWYRYSKTQGVVAEAEGKPKASDVTAEDREVARLYLALCANRGTPGDCKKLLVNSPFISQDGRYALAMSFAVERVCPEMLEAFKDMADPEAIKAALYWTMTVYALLWMAPEPVSKFLAAGISLSLIGYLGWDTLWTLIGGWRRLVDEVDRATTFSEIREAGERYGKIMGKSAARAFALLLSAAIGQTASSFAAKVPTLPGAAQASVQVGTQAGIRLSALAQVDVVSISTAGAVTIGLAPGAVTMNAEDAGGGGEAEPGGRVSGDDLSRLRQEFEVVKPKFWKNEAATNPGAYSPEQLARMRQGKPPIGADGYPMEVHHKIRLARGGTNSFENLEAKTRTDHRLGPNYKKNHPTLP